LAALLLQHAGTGVLRAASGLLLPAGALLRAARLLLPAALLGRAFALRLCALHAATNAPLRRAVDRTGRPHIASAARGPPWDEDFDPAKELTSASPHRKSNSISGLAGRRFPSVPASGRVSR
ncbi:MAG: hypothetical protein ACREV3_13690, partial [Gammaproteobacteria bacterium]